MAAAPGSLDSHTLATDRNMLKSLSHAAGLSLWAPRCSGNKHIVQVSVSITSRTRRIDRVIRYLHVTALLSTVNTRLFQRGAAATSHQDKESPNRCRFRSESAFTLYAKPRSVARGTRRER